ncbi:hypothetical protein C4K24_0895 [Pseudomonas chlororaphis subsp. aurantiaca]|nr:hypothetical protein C4K24_0895 [Pseudomonas chlororaphis subsp. aurantiaca]AZD52781.1 hypothetical protein C4K19_0975 [Pseudomonas chlororaphis subsp. aurantiaca]AZD58885.1 hypothetical protein C4K18_0893 [Pseudomonas chlororaphis subsp. aurantiaca]
MTSDGRNTEVGNFSITDLAEFSPPKARPSGSG